MIRHHNIIATFRQVLAIGTACRRCYWLSPSTYPPTEVQAQITHPPRSRLRPTLPSWLSSNIKPALVYTEPIVDSLYDLRFS